MSDLSQSAGLRGQLLKKAGGKAMDKKTRLMEKWHRRWFVLPPQSSKLSYYKNEQEQLDGKDALGSVECAGATGACRREASALQPCTRLLRCHSHETLGSVCPLCVCTQSF
jgi:hypothetical protein